MLSKFILLIAFAKGVLSPQIHYSCLNTDECKSAFTSKYYCNFQLTCEHLPISYSAMEVVGLVIVTLLVTITNTGGVGAGTVIVPTLMVFLKFIVTDAIPHARITVMCGSLITFVMVGLARSRSDKSKFETSYNLAATMSPLLLAGSQIGVMLSGWLPSTITGAILGSYLLISLVQTFRRAVKEIGREKRLDKPTSEYKPFATQISSNNIVPATTLEDESDLLAIPKRYNNQAPDKPKISKLQLELDTSNKTQKSKKKMIIENVHNFMMIILAMCVIVISTLLRGGRGVESMIGIKGCSLSSWLVLCASQIILAVISYISYRTNATVFTPEDVGISPHSRIPREHHHKIRFQLILASYVVGILAGLLGIGGGLVIGLYMMTMGLSMQSTTAFSNFIVLISSIATTLQFAVLGDIQLHNSYQFVVIALVGSFLGNYVFRPLLRKINKTSVVVWLVFGVLCIATVVLPAEIVKRP